ncbi:MAG: UDP-galactopyranose mutase [Bacteroidaceae bacterium]|nr:UDP-galactopyranose mutase [Bacteroidaceae bacterium]
MLEGVEIRTGVDFLLDKDYWISQAKEIVYTGSVDELMEYKLGELGYRSLRFETEILIQSNYQGMAVINETGADVPYTRTIEHKHFCYNSCSEHTIITKEYPQSWNRGQESYYPINNDINNHLYNEYCKMIKTVYPTIRLGGRLGNYRYYDMDDVVAMALQDSIQS